MLIHFTELPEPGVEAQLAGYGYPPGEIDLTIHVGDEMYHFGLDERHGSREVALFGYFQSGYTAFRLLQGVLDAHFGERQEPLKILDFASGYGRMTRFLVHHHGAEAVTISEIDPKAVAFQEERFGVRGVVSNTAPEELPLDAEANESDRFDAIFVASLFSHLPRHSFEGWLERLMGLLAPGGVLIFTVHDEAAMLAGRTMPEDGFYFEALSESEFLDLAEYGSTWVTEAFLKGAIDRAAEHVWQGTVGKGAASYHRIPWGLWHWQDAYVVTAGAEVDFSSWTVGRGVQGYLNVCSLKRSGELYLAGWGVDHHAHGPVEEVIITINGVERARLRPHGDLPEVVEYLKGDEAFLTSGWAVTLEPRQHPFQAGDVLLITTRDHHGPAVLHAGTLESALIYTNLDRDRRALHQARDQAERRRLALESALARADGLQRRAEELDTRMEALGYREWELEQRIAAMEASRFWKLRNAWFRLTGRA